MILVAETTTAVSPLNAIAREVLVDWQQAKGGISPHAWPYLEAMQTLDKITDNYYQDSAKSIVLYFLANAGTWRGETARRIKAELKAMVK